MSRFVSKEAWMPRTRAEICTLQRNRAKDKQQP